MSRSPVRVGVIGTGAIAAAQHIPELHANPDVTLVAFSGRREAQARAIAERYGVSEVCGGDDGWRQLIGRSDIDALLICTPNVLHAPIATLAAEAGQHILIEKPLAPTLEEARRIVAAASAGGVVCAVAYHRRFKPLYRETHTLLRAGILGRLYSVHAELSHAGPEAWAPTATWFFDPARAGGGAVVDLGTHMADLVTWLVGAKPVELASLVATQEKPTSLEDHSICMFRFADGMLGTITASWNTRPGARRVVVIGERGTLTADETAADGVVVQLAGDAPHDRRYRFPAPPLNAAGRARSGVADAFIAVLRGQQANAIGLATGAEAMAAQEILDAWYRAADACHTVRVGA